MKISNIFSEKNFTLKKNLRLLRQCLCFVVYSTCNFMVSVFINCLLWRSILANKTDEAGLFIPTPYFRNLMYYFLGVKILFRSWYPSYIACICPNLAILFNSNIWIAICCLFDRTEAHRFHDFPSKRVPWIYSLPTVLATVMLVIRSIVSKFL